jgi:hypothetical protein
VRVRIVSAAGIAAILIATTSAGQSRAGGREEVDRAVIFEFGAALEGEPSEGTVHTGGTFAFEITPVEHWLEIEAGVSAIAGGRGTEIPIDLLFKKPWPISPTFEFMIGAGPELIHATGADHATYWGVSAVLDFMFWPRRHVGWYVEPGYEATFRDGATSHGYAVAVGLLVGR